MEESRTSEVSCDLHFRPLLGTTLCAYERVVECSLPSLCIKQEAVPGGSEQEKISTFEVLGAAVRALLSPCASQIDPLPMRKFQETTIKD